jgi:hypothetical protein
MALPQEVRVIRVGVPVMKNDARRSVPVELERDRLVKALNDEKPDKKLHVKSRGRGPTGEQSAGCRVAGGREEVRLHRIHDSGRSAQGDPAEQRAGTININPNSQWGTQGPESAAMNPEFEATVEYRLY